MKIFVDKFKDEKALVIIEAAIVFPIVMFTIAFILFMGNALLEKAKVDSLTQKYAVIGAEMVADPHFAKMLSQNPDLNMDLFPNDANFFKDCKPYRYLLGVDEPINEITTSINAELNLDTVKLFKKQIDNPPEIDVKLKNGVLFQTFSVEITYGYLLPFSFAGLKIPPVTTISSKTEVAVNDADEFIRNTDMAIDYVDKFLDETNIGNKMQEFFKKITSFLNK